MKPQPPDASHQLPAPRVSARARIESVNSVRPWFSAFVPGYDLGNSVPAEPSLVKGHDFSRAAKSKKSNGLQPLRFFLHSPLKRVRGEDPFNFLNLGTRWPEPVNEPTHEVCPWLLANDRLPLAAGSWRLAAAFLLPASCFLL